MKKFTALLLTAAITMLCAAPATLAAESWRDAFVTRLMKLLSQDPTYSEVVLTDLDSNGIPEAFVYRNSSDGGISAGFTMTDSAITSINVPSNIIGACLSDITVYDKEGRTIFVGREIARNSSTICFYKLELSGDSLTATRINKSDVSPYPVITYEDMYGNDFLSSGYPSRTKIQTFIDSYDKVNTVTASQSASPIKVNGVSWDVAGYFVNNSNYYNIRDIAMILRNTGSCFNVDWDTSLSAVTITTRTKYVIIGGELEGTPSNAQSIEENSAPIYVDGQLVELTAYNIDGSNYFQIRDLADVIGFTVDWDGESVLITTT